MSLLLLMVPRRRVKRRFTNDALTLTDAILLRMNCLLSDFEDDFAAALADSEVEYYTFSEHTSFEDDFANLADGSEIFLIGCLDAGVIADDYNNLDDIKTLLMGYLNSFEDDLSVDISDDIGLIQDNLVPQSDSINYLIEQEPIDLTFA